MKFIMVVVPVAFVLALSACSGGSSSGGSNQTARPTYTENEANADVQKLSDAEMQLENVGLKFRQAHEYQNGSSRTTFSWDANFFQDYRDANPSTSRQAAIAALESYVSVATGFKNKYSGPIILKRNDGSNEEKQLLESVKYELEQKIALATRTLAEARSN